VSHKVESIGKSIHASRYDTETNSAKNTIHMRDEGAAGKGIE
jgi:hypothetical protein